MNLILSVVINRDVARVYRDRRELDSALEQIRKTIELEPNFPSSYNELAWVYLKQGRNAEALAAAEKAVELSKRAPGFLITLGESYIKLGKLAEAHAIVKELEEKYAKREASAGFIAWLYAGLGEKEKVFPWLEKALKDNNGNLDRLEEAPEFEFLRGDPRFKDLLRRMRLPE
jgi:tetratricopeptide (TPR) repeat protein